MPLLPELHESKPPIVCSGNSCRFSIRAKHDEAKELIWHSMKNWPGPQKMEKFFGSVNAVRMDLFSAYLDANFRGELARFGGAADDEMGISEKIGRPFDIFSSDIMYICV